jgi:hypothetical protein
VLLESKRPLKNPLPVLKRGPADRGPQVHSELPPSLEGIDYRDLRTGEAAFPAARLNDVVTLRGSRLPTRNIDVVIIDPQRKPTAEDSQADVVARLKPETGGTAEQMFVRLDETQGNWVCGPLQVVLEEQTEDEKIRRSRPLFLAVAPVVHDDDGLTSSLVNDNGTRKLMIRCRPGVAAGADGKLPPISLVLTPVGRGSPPPPLPLDSSTNNATLLFDVGNVPPGTYRVRLRIDTVETLVMQRDQLGFSFDERQTVRL